KEKDDEGSQDSHIIYDELFNEDQLKVLEDEEDDDEDCCVNSYVAFTEELSNENQCPE
ncbi:6468_t:CDS:2, partial [Funneliformis caledonium]